MPFTLIRQDITKMQVDAIVNAANTGLQMGGGVCGAIFRAAGAERLQAACDKLAPIQTGEAAITPGFKLSAKYVIHAAGPVYSSRNKEESQTLLRSAYIESLKLAEKNRCESIAFPLISSGIYGYPKDEALKVARQSIGEFLQDHDMDVYLAVFDKSSFQIGEALLGKVEHYIDQHYVDAHTAARGQLLQVEKDALEKAQSFQAMLMAGAAAAPKQSLNDLIKNLDEPFSAALLKLIDQKGRSDVEVYKRANLDRKLFSKIRTGKGYTPKKPTILALAIALELTLDTLLERAGYALSHASKFDVIVEYFIVNGQYDIFQINEVLFAYDQPLLGS